MSVGEPVTDLTQFIWTGLGQQKWRSMGHPANASFIWATAF